MGAVLGDRLGYRLGEPPTVRVDLDEAADLVAQACRRLAEGAPGMASTAARRALDLVEAEPLVEEDDSPWVVDVRRRWGELRRTAHHHAAKAALDSGDAAVASTLASSSLAADPYDESAMRLLLAADQAVGEPARAIVAYHEFRARLIDELGIQPSPLTRETYLALLQEAPALPATRPIAPRAKRWPGASAGTAQVMVGRAAETARLVDQWEHAGAGDAGVVLVVGEAGIGKTRLAAELQRIAGENGARVAVGRCHVAERSLFLQPLVDALGSTLAALPAHELCAAAGHHARVLGGLFPDLAGALGLPDLEASASDARRTFEAIGALLRALTTTRAMLLVLDDLHNAGMATTELLHHLALRVGDARLLVVATVRLEEGTAALATLERVAEPIDLGPLSPADVTELAGRAGHADREAAITRRTRGNPFFVVEVLRGWPPATRTSPSLCRPPWWPGSTGSARPSRSFSEPARSSAPPWTRTSWRACSGWTRPRPGGGVSRPRRHGCWSRQAPRTSSPTT